LFTTTFPKEYATMQERSVDRFIVPVPQSRNVLTEIARAGAQKLLREMIRQQVAEWLAKRDRKLEETRLRRQQARQATRKVA
jgi:hypothetical protein